jgi:hypothetical protein
MRKLLIKFVAKRRDLMEDEEATDLIEDAMNNLVEAPREQAAWERRFAAAARSKFFQKWEPRSIPTVRGVLGELLQDMEEHSACDEYDDGCHKAVKSLLQDIIYKDPVCQRYYAYIEGLGLEQARAAQYARD